MLIDIKHQDVFSGKPVKLSQLKITPIILGNDIHHKNILQKQSKNK